mgnify:CR=1 FL=1
MKKIILVFSSLFLTTLSFGEVSTESRVVGTWCEIDKPTNTCFGYTAYYSDNSYYAYGVLYEFDVKFASQGTWKHQNGKACITPERQSFVDIKTGQKIDPKLPLTEYCDSIIDITDKVYLYENHIDGSKVRMLKVSHKPNKSFQPRAKAPAE